MTPAPGPGKSPRSVTPAPDTCPAQNPGKTPVKPFFPRSQPRCLFPAALWMLRGRTGALGDLGTHTQRGGSSPCWAQGGFCSLLGGFFYFFFCFILGARPATGNTNTELEGGKEGRRRWVLSKY